MATGTNNGTVWFGSAATPSGGSGLYRGNDYSATQPGGLMGGAPQYYQSVDAATAALGQDELAAARNSFGDFATSGMSWANYLDSTGSRDQWQQTKIDMANQKSADLATQLYHKQSSNVLPQLQSSFDVGGHTLSQWQAQNGGTGSWADFLDSNNARDDWQRYKIESVPDVLANGGVVGPNTGGLGAPGYGETRPGGSTSGGYTTAYQTGDYSYNPGSYDAMLGVAAQMTAQGMYVTPDMLVNQQLAGIMQSPVGQIAMDIAREQMAARGMLDSTAAQNAIVQAAMTAGLPIAQADARAYFDAASATMQAENAAREANMGAQNTQILANQSATNAANAFNAGASDLAVRYGIDAAEAARIQDSNTAFQQQVFESDNAYRETTLEMDDYWKKMDFNESQRQYNEGLDLNAYQAETARLQTEYQAASTDYQRRTAVMSMFERLWETDLSQADAAKVATVTLETLGLPDEDVAEMLTTFVENYTTPEIVVSG